MLPTTKPRSLSVEDFNAGKAQFHKLEQGEISLTEYLKEIAYFALLCGFDELVPHLLPTRPNRLFQHDDLNYKEKRDIKEKFWQDNEIAEYIKSCKRVVAQNRANLEWLYELSLTLKDDPVNLGKIRTWMNEFKAYPNYDKIIEVYRRKNRLLNKVL